MSSIQTTVDIVKGDMSGSTAITDELREQNRLAENLRRTLQELGGIMPSTQERLEGDRLRVQEVEARRQLAAENRQARAERHTQRKEVRADRDDDRAETLGRRRAQGVGHMAGSVLSSAASGNPAGAIGALSSFTANPWMLGGIGLAGVAAMTGFSGMSEQFQSASKFHEAIAGLAPFTDRTALGAYNLGVGLGGARDLGYSATAAAQRYTSYLRASGLEGRGLGVGDVLSLERTRGVTAEQSGSASAIFAAGRGGIAKDQESVRMFFRHAVAEGTAAGITNAHLGEYIGQLAQSVSRFAARGYDVDPRNIMGHQAAIRALNPEVFAGARAGAALDRARDIGMGIAGEIPGVVSPQMLRAYSKARALAEAGGDPIRAALMLERESAEGHYADRLTRDARGLGGGNRFGALLLAGQGFSMLEAVNLIKLKGGSKNIGVGELRQDNPLLDQSLKGLREAADLENTRTTTGMEGWDKLLKIERTKAGIKNWLGGTTTDFMDWLTGPFGTSPAPTTPAGKATKRAQEKVEEENPNLGPGAMNTRGRNGTVIAVLVQDARTGQIGAQSLVDYVQVVQAG